MKQQQVAKATGYQYAFNLDVHTLNQLKAISEEFLKSGLNISTSVIVRRAIQLYLQHVLTNVRSAEAMLAENILLDKARRGVA